MRPSTRYMPGLERPTNTAARRFPESPGFSRGEVQVEHIFPQARSGSDDLDNLALACHACNLFKSDFETGHDKASQAEVALFHPRRDSWAQHLGVDAEGVE